MDYSGGEDMLSALDVSLEANALSPTWVLWYQCHRTWISGEYIKRGASLCTARVFLPQSPDVSIVSMHHVSFHMPSSVSMSPLRAIGTIASRDWCLSMADTWQRMEMPG